MADALPVSRVSEAAFQGQVIDLAKTLGWDVYHTWLSTRSTPGFPDLVLVRPPRVVFAELKNDIGRVTPDQQAWLDRLRQCPAIEVYLWRPRDFDDVLAVLQKEHER